MARLAPKFPHAARLLEPFRACTLLVLLLATDSAWARARGIVAEGCAGCHGAEAADVSASIAPVSFGPGDEINVTVVIGGAVAGGVYVDSDGVGTFRVLGGEGLTQVSAGLTHESPKAASGGRVEFRFAWRAPAAPGSVRFAVYAVAADGNGRSSGDQGGTAFADAVFGCTGLPLYRDGDGDGFGRDAEPLLKCAGDSVAGYATQAGDCDDFRPEVNAGAVELCDQRDNDCDEDVDEDAVPVELWPDPDGDGYHDGSGDPIMGCVGISGYAADWGDCAPSDPLRHLDAEEVCNGLDDNCDNLTDERTRPQCGVGWCRRESDTCQIGFCMPGSPEPETCNGLDDDCDDETDEGALCPTGAACIAGECIPNAAVPVPNQPDAGAVDAGQPRASPPDSGGCAVGARTRSAEPGLWLGPLLAGLLRRRSSRRAL